MKVGVFSTKPYDRAFLDRANANAGHDLTYFTVHLSSETAPLARGMEAVCPFVNDTIDGATLRQLADLGVRLIALRSAGFNNVDLAAAKAFGVAVARVPAYSPHAVAEHTVALILTLNRQIHRAYNRVREGNFALDGLLGFDLCGKTVGVVGTGKIGEVVARILSGFGCRILAHDVAPNPACEQMGVAYVGLGDLFASSDIVTLHCPLTPATHHLVNADLIAKAKRGVMLINTSRGGVVDTRAIIAGLKDGTIGYVGLDVYEEEADLFFEDLSSRVIEDDVFARLLTFPNVVVTGHQAFFTREALTAIAQTTIDNITSFAQQGRATHEVSTDKFVAR